MTILGRGINAFIPPWVRPWLRALMCQIKVDNIRPCVFGQLTTFASETTAYRHVSVRSCGVSRLLYKVLVMSWTGACRSNTPDKRAGARNTHGSSFVFYAQLTFITAQTTRNVTVLQRSDSFQCVTVC